MFPRFDYDVYTGILYLLIERTPFEKGASLKLSP